MIATGPDHSGLFLSLAILQGTQPCICKTEALRVS